MEKDQMANSINSQSKTDAGKVPASHSLADFDEDTYRPYLDGLNISDKQASELMRIVWDIMRMWVEMDLPVDSCGQIVESIINPIPDESNSPD